MRIQPELHYYDDRLYSHWIRCLFYPWCYLKYWAIQRKLHFNIFFSSISVTLFPLANLIWKLFAIFYQTGIVCDIEQRPSSLVATKSQDQCNVLYYLKVKWKSVILTARQINMFISYSKYIILVLGEHSELGFSVYNWYLSVIQ